MYQMLTKNSLEEVAVRETTPIPQEERENPKYRVLYDGQCEVCQACVSWLRVLDHERKTICLPVSEETLMSLDSRLTIDECLRQLHILTPRGEIIMGWDAVACLARLFSPTVLIGTLGARFPIRNFAELIYGFVAAHRYALSKCRGGACRVAKPELVKHHAGLRAFWSCYTLGFFIRSPLILWSGLRSASHRISIFARTHHKRLDLLDGKLTILFLNGILPNTVPVLFG
jgi:predicted DCC family thiol-disulfide oxidoreductase YuxK